MMEAAAVEEHTRPRRVYFPWISWGAISGGVVSCMATTIILSVFGLAMGLPPITAGHTLNALTFISGIWTSIGFLASSFGGGYVSGIMSGLSRRADGVLHGLVVWGASILVWTFLLITPLGSLAGGTFALAGQGGSIIAGKGAVTHRGESGLQWMLFLGVLCSMGMGMFGGATGSRSAMKRRRPVKRENGAGKTGMSTSRV